MSKSINTIGMRTTLCRVLKERGKDNTVSKALVRLYYLAVTKKLKTQDSGLKTLTIKLWPS